MEAGWILAHSIPGFLCFAPSLRQAGLPVVSVGVLTAKDNRDGCSTRKFWDIYETCLSLISNQNRYCKFSFFDICSLTTEYEKGSVPDDMLPI
jgi:hypothetical protein